MPFLCVVVPVADLMKGPAGQEFEGLRETQLLMNENLIYLGENKDWFYVEAPEQLRQALNDEWGGYPGWVLKRSVAFTENPVSPQAILIKGTIAFTSPSEVTACGDLYLSAGTKVALTGEKYNELVGIHLPDGVKKWVRKDVVLHRNSLKNTGEQRRQIIETAMSFSGTPYLWGGRSTHVPSLSPEKQSSNTADRCFGTCRLPHGNAQATGVDCSGLTNLAYRTIGIDIPRNARDQWLASRIINPQELKAADPIFLSTEEHHDRVVHVMVFLGNEEFIEATETGSTVMVNTFIKKFGQTMDDIISNNSMAGNAKVHWGTFMEDI